MRVSRLGGASVALSAILFSALAGAQSDPASYRSWSRERAEVIGRSTRVNGRVGGAWDLRVLRTERSYNYKLRATLMTPEVVRATARLAQLSDGLTDAETEALVAAAEKAGSLTVMFEVDPREGSGVIPPDMVVLLRRKGSDNDATLRGSLRPDLRSTRALSGAWRRDYAYEQFWAVFDVSDERAQRVIGPESAEMEFVLRIYDKEGRVDWKIPDSIRR